MALFTFCRTIATLPGRSRSRHHPRDHADRATLGSQRRIRKLALTASNRLPSRDLSDEHSEPVGYRRAPWKAAPTTQADRAELAA